MKKYAIVCSIAISVIVFYFYENNVSQVKGAALDEGGENIPPPTLHALPAFSLQERSISSLQNQSAPSSMVEPKSTDSEPKLLGHFKNKKVDIHDKNIDVNGHELRSEFNKKVSDYALNIPKLMSIPDSSISRGMVIDESGATLESLMKEAVDVHTKKATGEINKDEYEKVVSALIDKLIQASKLGMYLAAGHVALLHTDSGNTTEALAWAMISHSMGYKYVVNVCGLNSLLCDEP